MPKTNLKIIPGKAKSKLEDEVDALFRLSLSEFIGARKTLTVKLKQEGRRDEAERVNSLAKPSVSAWTVNQLYWQQRDLFDQLIATGQRLRQAQAKGRTGKPGDLRAAFEERREVLSQLSDLAAALMRDAGHNPALDTLRRVATTLEAMSAYASLPDGVSAGQLTQDIDPPGFDSLGSFAPERGPQRRSEEPARVSRKSPDVELKTRQKLTAAAEEGRLKKARQARLAAAKLSLQEAKRSLVVARSRTRKLEAAQKKADAETKEADKHRREAERRLKEAAAASELAVRRSRNLTVEVEQAREILEEATRSVTRASTELESLFRES